MTALIRDRGRVTGVRVARNGSEQVLEAGLVVGADGRNSTVAGLFGSRKYNLTVNERFVYWSFFPGADLGAEPTAIFHRWSGNFAGKTWPGIRAMPGWRRQRTPGRRRSRMMISFLRRNLPGLATAAGS